MYCPICTGTGFGRAFYADLNSVSDHPPCPHCDGTGRPKAQDIWLCTMPDGRTQLPLSLREEPEGLVWREYDAYYALGEVTPVHRLLEVVGDQEE